MNSSVGILYEDQHLLVINKPAGLVVHADGKTDEPTLVDWLLERYPDMRDVGEPIETINQKTKEPVTILRPGIVHRIDRETSGCLVIAKDQEAYEYLKQQFQDRTVEKTYRAIVWGNIKSDMGTINAPIGRSASNFRQWSAQRGARGEMREAITQYEVAKRFVYDGEHFTEVIVRPKTGRTHQIRVHFKYLNNPILCDSLYAPNRGCMLGFSRLALHAESITFTSPNGERVSVNAPLPEDFTHALGLN